MIFKSSHLGQIAGCLVLEGIIKRGQKAKLIRGSQTIWEGKISSLKKVKEDVKEVQKGTECGIILDRAPALEEKDLIESNDISYLTQEL